jgi:hypothetical protein
MKTSKETFNKAWRETSVLFDITVVAYLLYIVAV